MNEKQAPFITRWFVDHPWTVVVAIVCVTAFFGYFARQIERDHSTENMLPADEPIRSYWDEFQKHFDIHTKIAIGLQFEDSAYSPEALAQIDRLSEWLENEDDLEDVQSLTTVENITAREGEILAGPLVETPPTTPEEIDAVRDAVRSNRLIRGLLVSEDETAAMIVVQPLFMTWETSRSGAAYERIKGMLDADPGPGKAHLAGFPMIIARVDRYMDRDMRVMLPIVFAAVILLLFASFRSLRGVWIPLAVVVAATIWTYGVMSLIGVKITIISTSIPIVLVAMGIADGIHIIHEYYHHLRQGAENRDAVLRTMTELNAPVVMTSVTTAVGFLALGTADIVPIREYGGAVAFGVLAAMVFSLSFIPASLMILGRPKRVLSARVAEGGTLQRISVWIGVIGHRRARLVIGLFIAALVVTTAISTRLRARNNPVEYFRAHSEIRQADAFLNVRFAGTGEMHVTIDTKTPGGAKDPALMNALRTLEERLEAMDMVGRTRSLADFLQRMHFVMNDEDPAFDRVPGTPEDMGDAWTPEAGRARIAQYLLLYELAGGEAIASTVDYEYRRANIEVMTRSHDSQDYARVLKEIRNAEPALAALGVDVGETGSGIVNLKIVQYLVLGQIYSLALSFGVVFLMLIGLFRSLRYALVGVIPLVITVTHNFAFMVVTGIPLNMGTALIASVCIGIGVDYSIHFISRYRLEAARTPDLAACSQATMATSGRAILLNALAVGGGFAVLMFSSFQPVVYLGYLVPLIMLGNAVAALLVIPAFLSVIYGKRKVQG